MKAYFHHSLHSYWNIFLTFRNQQVCYVSSPFAPFYQQQLCQHFNFYLFEAFFLVTGMSSYNQSSTVQLEKEECFYFKDKGKYFFQLSVNSSEAMVSGLFPPSSPFSSHMHLEMLPKEHSAQLQPSSNSILKTTTTKQKTVL